MSAERELHLEERPTSLKMMVGQPDAIAQLKGMRNNIPHAILFTGPSGCGKTTLARILRRKLKCGEHDFQEINAAENRGIDMVRRLQQQLSLAPITGETRVFLVDECHQLTADAQGALLKILEEPPDHAYVMLATTNPEKLRQAIRTRCTDIKVRSLDEGEIVGLVNRVHEERMDCPLAEEVALRLAEVADGSARKALVLLGQIMGVEDDDRRIEILQKSDVKRTAYSLCQALVAGRPWTAVAEILRDCDEEPEQIRWLVLSFFTTVAIGKKDPKTGKVRAPGKDASRAVAIMEEFQDNYFDTKRAGLIISAYRATNGNS